jgi:hypothetical protein
MRYSRACGSHPTNEMASHYSWHAKAHSLHLPKGLDSYFDSIDYKVSDYENLDDATTMLELAIWKSKIAE